MTTGPLASPLALQGAWAVGHVLMLIDPVFPGSPSAQQDAVDLLALLERRRFLRWHQLLERTAPLDAVHVAMAAFGLGCRLLAETGEVAALEEPRAASLLLTCRSNAHVALAVVAERSGRFQALAIGRVVERGFELHVNGRQVRTRPKEEAVADDKNPHG